MINGVTTTPPDLRNLAAGKSREANESAEGRDRNEAAGQEGGPESGDRVTLGSKPAGGVYGKPVAGENPVDARLMVIREIVARMFEKQGLSLTIDLGGGRSAKLAEITPRQASDLVSEDGYWGVEKTSQRIADFAIGAAGNDPSKLDLLKESVLKGYSMAGKGFGGALPDISKKTLDAVMAKLDEWAKEQPERFY